MTNTDQDRPSRSAIQRVLDAALTNSTPPQWTFARKRISAERDAVESWLDAGGQAYGFTTLLGHLDGRALEWKDRDAARAHQSDLAAGHRIGSAMREPLGATRSGLVLAAKIEQLSCGGSGVSPHSFDRFLSALTQGLTLRLPLELSYSSADVVPNAWVIDEVFEGRADELAPGDLIALLSGHALPAAEAIPVICVLSLSAAQFHLRRAAVTDAIRRDTAVQLPISLRDPVPVLTEGAAVLDGMLEAVDRRLRTRASNPLFRFDRGGDVTGVDSTAGFLDFSLTAAMDRASSFVLTLSHLLQRLIETVVDVFDGSDPGGEHLRIQYPKAGMALQFQTQATYAETRGFHSATSRGVEDLWDLSLLTVYRLTMLQAALSKQLLLFDELTAGTSVATSLGPSSRAREEAARALSLACLRISPTELDRLVAEVAPPWPRATLR